MYLKKDIKKNFSKIIKEMSQNIDKNNYTESIEQYVINNFPVPPKCKIVPIGHHCLKAAGIIRILDRFDFSVILENTSEIDVAPLFDFSIEYNIPDNTFDLSKMSFKKTYCRFAMLDSDVAHMLNKMPDKNFDYGSYSQIIYEQREKFYQYQLNYIYSRLLKTYFNYRQIDDINVEKKFKYGRDTLNRINELLYESTDYRKDSIIRISAKENILNKLAATYENKDIFSLELNIFINDSTLWKTYKLDYVEKEQISFFVDAYLQEFYNDVHEPACGHAVFHVSYQNVFNDDLKCFDRCFEY